jgi:hypothetical protein
MSNIEEILSQHSSVELLEYEVVAGGHVHLRLLGYPKDIKHPVSRQYSILLRGVESIRCEALHVPIEVKSATCIKAPERCTFNLELAEESYVSVICMEIILLLIK